MKYSGNATINTLKTIAAWIGAALFAVCVLLVLFALIASVIDNPRDLFITLIAGAIGVAAVYFMAWGVGYVTRKRPIN